LNLYFTISAGRTGTKFLSKLLRNNAPQENLPIYHEQIKYFNWGTRIPDLSHMLLFNIEGNNDRVQSFWESKIEQIKEESKGIDYYVETSHRFFKAGLIENLIRLLDPTEHTVHIIDLRRAVIPTIKSYVARADLATYENRWIWYLDMKYTRNILKFDTYEQLNMAHTLKIRLWYIHEVWARAALYKIRYNNHPLFKFHWAQLKDLNDPAYAQSLLRKLEWLPQDANAIIPEPQNTTKPQHRPNIEGRVWKNLEATLEQLNFNPVQLAEEFDRLGGWSD
jgi:hypothetical protein